MRIEGDVLILPEAGPYFDKAERGARTNSIFSTNRPGHAEFLSQHVERLVEVRIYDPRSGREFQREITDLTHWGAIADAYFWVVTWRHDESAIRVRRRN